MHKTVREQRNTNFISNKRQKVNSKSPKIIALLDRPKQTKENDVPSCCRLKPSCFFTADLDVQFNPGLFISL